MTAAPRPSQADADADVVAAYLTDQIGLSLAGSRRVHLVREIHAAMANAGAVSGAAYRAQLDDDATELAALVARVTVGESYFFRDRGQLDVLRSVVLPERRAAKGPDALIRVWSAGCAIGQEAYTLAILLEEEGLGSLGRILATDLAAGALRVAREGVYGSWSLRAVTPQERDAYFHAIGAGHEIDERFMRSVTFREMNLVDLGDDPPRNMDVILCRNVLIYFTPDAVARVARNLASALAPGGWLITGSSDPPLDRIAELQSVSTPAGLAYRPAGVESTPHGGEPRESGASTPRARRTVRVVAAPPAIRREVRPAGRSRSAVEDSAEVDARAVRMLGDAGDLCAALDAAGHAIERFPLHVELRYLKAVVLLEAGRPSEAAASAKAAIFLDPDLVVAHLVLARAVSALGDRDAARRSLRHAIALLDVADADAVVQLSDGEPASRLLAMATAHDRALAGPAPHRTEAT